MAAPKKRQSDVRVGIFVAIGIATTLASLFLVGQERKLWESTADLRGQFSNVGGLKVGGAVRLAGSNIGIVSRIDLPPMDPKADERVVGALDIGDLAVGGTQVGETIRVPTPRSSDLAEIKRGRCTNVAGCLLLPLREKKFASPIPLALVVRDQDEKLEVVIHAVGRNLHGNPAEERILVRLRNENEGVSVGKVFFSSLERVAITVLKDNTVVVEESDSDAQRKRHRPFVQVGDGSTRKMNVVMRVSEKYLERVRTDSEASIASEGLLGDKYIDISIGSVSKPKVNDGDLLLSNDAVDFGAALASTGEIIDNINASTESVRVLLEGFRKAGGEATVVAAVQSIQDIAEEIQRGRGLIHQLIFDKKTGSQYQDIVENVKLSTEKANASLAQLDQILQDVRSNQSLANTLLFGDSGRVVVADAQKLIGEAAQIAADIRGQPGFIHNLIYEKDRGEILANANVASAEIKQISTDLRAIISDARKGKGTVGALLVDPGVYEDLKVLLGNVRRNDAVKALVRYAIEQEDKKAQQAPEKK